jgi:hypothetical protein
LILNKIEKPFTMEVANVSTYSPYSSFAACPTVVRSPLSTQGLDHALWTEKYRDPTVSDAVQLNAFKGLACERTGNAPERDDQFFSVIVEQKPVFQLPPPVTMESDNVPSIWQTQVSASCGFDIEREDVYTTTDYTVYCTK